MRRGSWVWGVLGLVGLAGVALRFVGLDEKLLWHDEVFTRVFAAGHAPREWFATLYGGAPVTAADLQAFQHLDPSKGPWDTVLGLARDEPQHPPLYYLLARLWMGLFGDGIGALRALSAVFSLGGLAAGGWLAHEAFGRRAATATAVALLAASPVLGLYAQEAREYSLWSAEILASCAALLRAQRRMAEGAPARWAWVIYGALTTAALYTSFSHAGVIAAQVLFVAWRARGRLTAPARAAAATLTVSALACLPWALMLRTHYAAFQASMAWAREIVIPRAELLSTFGLNLSRPIVDGWAQPTGWAWAAVAGGAALSVGALAAVGWAARRQGAGRLGPGALLVLVAVAPVALLLGPDLVLGGIRSLSTRYLMPTLVMALVALGQGLSQPGWPRRVVTVAVAAAMALSVGHNARTDAPWIKGISQALPQVVAQVRAAPDPLIVGNREAHNPGNLMALAAQLPPTVRFHLLLAYEGYRLPPHAGAVFLFSPVPWFPGAVAAAHGVEVQPVIQGLHLSLWQVTGRPAAPGP